MDSDLRASLSGKDLPEDIKQRLLALHEDNVTLKESLKTANEKLTKAKTVRASSLSTGVFEFTGHVLQFIKNQDKLYKEETAKGAGSSSVSIYICSEQLMVELNLSSGNVRGSRR